MSRPPSRDSQDTIVAIATPPGAAALGVIRLSGPEAVAAAGAITRLRDGRPLQGAPARALCLTTIVDPVSGAVIDDALVVRMPAPHSYTGEDLVELSCHGNPLLLARIVSLLVTWGARLAAPGEFTRRAYLNGRMDLLQAEAVAELIAARSERALDLAARELRGGLSRELGEVRERTLDLVASLEVALDFPEDEAGPAWATAVGAVEEIEARLARLIERTRRGRVVQDGLSVMLVGAPNVGKSSLLNALLGRERAIVAPEAGTTRDLVDGTLALAGMPVRLVDGAGLGIARDAIDAEAMRRAREAMEASELLLVVVDVSRPLASAERAILDVTGERPRLVVGNKCDLGIEDGQRARADAVCSALTGVGVEALREQIEGLIRAAVAPDGDESAIVASLRVAEGLGAARRSLARARDGLAARAALETALVDLGDTLGQVERLLGVAVEDAVLDRIFARFCVGK